MADAAPSAKVIPFPAQPERIRIATIQQAIAWGDAWQRHAERMEMLYDCACIQRDIYEALLKIAETELERLRKILA